LNYKMFAYCPGINQKVCGISDDSTNTDMTLYATKDEAKLSSTSLKYREGGPTVRAYDACYYLIKSPADFTEEDANAIKGDKEQARLYFKLVKGSEMNVQIFGGKSRDEATKSIVKNNWQVEVGKEYSIDYTEGILVVAYPNKDQTTDFEFTYWIGGWNEPGFFDFDSENGATSFLILSIIFAVLIIICLTTFFFCCRKIKPEKNKISDADRVTQF